MIAERQTQSAQHLAQTIRKPHPDSALKIEDNFKDFNERYLFNFSQTINFDEVIRSGLIIDNEIGLMF